MKNSEAKTKTFFPSQTLVPAAISSGTNAIQKKSMSRYMSLEKRMVTEQSKFSDMLYNTCYLQVRPGKIVKYSFAEFRSEKQKEIGEKLNNSNTVNYNGEISVAGQRRLKKKLEIWYEGIKVFNSSKEHVIQHTKKEMVFLTVTLPASQQHSDLEIKREILKPFMRILREKFNTINYIWKAESQANGNIHFHIVIDVYIEKKIVTEIWNKCCESLSYVSRFEIKFNHRNPPSTEIHMVKDFRTAMIYFQKYIVKSSEYRLIEGAVWKSSTNLKSLEYFECVSDSFKEIRLDKLLEKKEISCYSSDRYEIYYLGKVKIDQVLSSLDLKAYLSYKSLLSSYLFSNDNKIDFRQFSFLHTHPYLVKDLEQPIISTLHYPTPIQLELFECEKVKFSDSIDKTFERRYKNKFKKKRKSS
jgi:hypothetical protein